MAIRTEDDVIENLKEMGHEVEVLGLDEEIAPLRKAHMRFKPHVVFNLLEEFRGQPMLDYHVVAYLVLRGAAYTGCNPRGLLLARDKALSKKILHYHRINVPHFAVFLRGRRFKRPPRLTFPVIVKSLTEEASTGIAQASVVYDDAALADRVAFVHDKIGTAAIAEQLIEGRELYSAVLGNQRLEVLPTWELDLSQMPSDSVQIATHKVKWDLDYQKRHKIELGPAKDLSESMRKKIVTTTKRICRALGVDGYCRVDFRLTDSGELFFLEANPNPDVAYSEAFPSAAEKAGMSYHDLLQRIVTMGIRRAKL